MIEKTKTSRIISMMMALCIAAMFFTSGMAVLAQDSTDAEPNDYTWEAATCYDGDYISGSVDDTTDVEDYYQIWLNSGDTITVELYGMGTDFNLYLLDPYQWNAAGSFDYGSIEEVTYTAETTGYWYFYVRAQSGSGSYSLEVSVIEGTGGSSGEIYVGGDYYVTGDPLATVPTMTVGDGAYWGGVKDLGAEIEDELDAALAEYENYGFDVTYDINGGIGAYFGMEVASASANVDGIDCYDIEIMGAVAIDLGLEASVDGAIEESGYSVSVDGSGSGYVAIEANLEGHIYMTVDEMAIAKIELKITAEGHGEGNLNADMTMQGVSQSIIADVNVDIEDVQIDLELTFDPPIDIYQFGTGNGADGIYEGKEWYVPAVDTDVSGSSSAQGTITYDVHAEVPGEDPVDESETKNLATEIGDNNFSEIIPGGEPDGWYGGGGTMFTCSYASGDIFIIETDMTSALGMDYGTRQMGIPDVGSMIPTTGLQFNKNSGLITGMAMAGEVMTETVSLDEVEEFIANPLKEVNAVTGGHASGLDMGLLGIILIGVVVIIVVVLVVVMLTKKKTPPVHHHPQQYQQPPPPPMEYQPQYQQQEQYHPPDQYQQPPPPPPPGY